MQVHSGLGPFLNRHTNPRVNFFKLGSTEISQYHLIVALPTRLQEIFTEVPFPVIDKVSRL